MGCVMRGFWCVMVVLAMNSEARAADEAFGESVQLSQASLSSISGGFDTVPREMLTTINARIENNSVTLQAGSGSLLSGNRVENVLNGATGVFGITQNTGAQANVQQVINVNIGSLTLPGASL